jgi:hypothetical protein
LALVLLIVTAILDKLLVGVSQPVYAGSMLAANVIIALATIQLLRSYAQLRRKRFPDDRPVATAPEADFKELVVQE